MDSKFFEGFYGNPICPQSSVASGINRNHRTKETAGKAPEDSDSRVAEIMSEPMTGQDNSQNNQAVLLSVIFRIVSRIEVRLEKMSGGEHNHSQVNVGKPDKRKFIDYINDTNRAQRILEQLHEWIDGKRKVKALVYIKAAIDANIIIRPPYDVANEEFTGCLGSKSLYYVYTSEPMMFTEEDIKTICFAKDILSHK